MGLRNNYVHILGQHSVPYKNSEKEKKEGEKRVGKSYLFMPGFLHIFVCQNTHSSLDSIYRTPTLNKICNIEN